MDYYGLDVHKMSTTYACLSPEGKVLRRGQVPTKADDISGVIAPSKGDAWVVLEATGNWSYVYDVLQPLAYGVSLAHPRRVKAIAWAKVKTDAVDAITLAQLLRTGLLPASYVPPVHIRYWRELLRSRQALVHARTACKVRIHSLLAKEGLVSPVTDLFGRGGRLWLAQQSLPPTRQFLLDTLLTQVDSLNEGIKSLEARLKEELGGDAVVRGLMKEVPGFGFLTAAAFVAEVGEVNRFPRSRHLISYLGLAPRIRSSGGHTHLGRLTKEGPPLARAYLAQAAQGAIRRPGQCRELFLRVQARGGTHAARMAVARKLIVLAYHQWRSSMTIS